MQKVLIRMYLALFSGGAAQEKSPSLALAGQPGTVNSLDQAQMRDPLLLSLRFNGGGAQQRASPHSKICSAIMAQRLIAIEALGAQDMKEGQRFSYWSSALSNRSRCAT